MTVISCLDFKSWQVIGWLAVGGGVHFCRVRTAPKSPLYAHHLRCVLACGVGVGLPIQWLNVAIWGNGWAWWCA